MLSKEDFDYYARKLTSNDPDDRGYGARNARAEDIGDERLLPLLEPLLQDKRFTITGGMPPRYCEVRLLAAKAINRQKKLLGLPGKVSSIGFVYPGSYGMMSVFAERKTGIGMMDRPSFDSTSAELEYLNKQGVLPVFTSDKYPYLDYSTLPGNEDED